MQHKGRAQAERPGRRRRFLVVRWAMQGREEEDALQGHGGSLMQENREEATAAW
jgi:hypothetical protein